MLDTAAPGDPFAAVLGTDRARTDLGTGRRTFGARRFAHRAGLLEAPALAEDLIIFQLAGTSAVDRHLGGRWSPVPSHAGLVTVVPAGIASAWHVGGGIEVLHLYLGAPVLAEVAGEMYPALGGSPRLLARSGVADNGVARIAASVLDELALGEAAPLGRLHADLLARSLAVQLLRRHAPTGTRLAPPADVAVGSKRLRRALEHLEAHLADDVSLADLAGAANLSPWHFARAFRAAVGASPLTHLRRRRVERAQELLARTDLPLAEVALACGFKGQSHFGQVFRRAVGVAPGAFRRGQR